MTKTSNFNRLADLFTTKNAEFKIFENDFLARRNVETRESIEKDIDKFQKWLSVFTDLYTDISKEALIEDVAGHRTKYINWLNVIINRIQFIYLTQLSYRLSYLYNKHNLFVARVSIIIGVAIAIISLAFPYVMPNKFEDEMENFSLTSQSQHQRILELESKLLKYQKTIIQKQDSLAVLKRSAHMVKSKKASITSE